jgi:hypothetical protein
MAILTMGGVKGIAWKEFQLGRSWHSQKKARRNGWLGRGRKAKATQRVTLSLPSKNSQGLTKRNSLKRRQLLNSKKRQ